MNNKFIIWLLIVIITILLVMYYYVDNNISKLEIETKTPSSTGTSTNVILEWTWKTTILSNDVL